MKDEMKRIRHSIGVHVRRQAVGYVALLVALGGTAYAGGKANSSKVGGQDLRPFEIRFGDRVTVPVGDEGASLASCERGERAIAPGVAGGTAAAAVNGITAHGQTGKKGFRPTGFRVSATNEASAPREIRAEVLCLRR